LQLQTDNSKIELMDKIDTIKTIDKLTKRLKKNEC